MTSTNQNSKATRIGGMTFRKAGSRPDTTVSPVRVANLKEGKVMNTNNVRQRAVTKAIVSYINRGYVCPVTIIESVKIAHDAVNAQEAVESLYRRFPAMRPEAK